VICYVRQLTRQPDPKNPTNLRGNAGLEWLGKALAAGYSKSVVGKTPDLDNLHDNPRYQALMQQK